MEHDGMDCFIASSYIHTFFVTVDRLVCKENCFQTPLPSDYEVAEGYYSLLTEHRRIRITVSIDHEYHLNNLMNTPHQIHQLRNIPYILMGGWFIVGPAESLTEHETEGETNRIGQSVSWL